MTATLLSRIALIEESTEAKSPNAAPVLRTYVRSKTSETIVLRLVDLHRARHEALGPLIEEEHRERDGEVGAAGRAWIPETDTLMRRLPATTDAAAVAEAPAPRPRA